MPAQPLRRSVRVTGLERNLTRRFPAWLRILKLESFLPVKRLAFPARILKAVCFQLSARFVMVMFERPVSLVRPVIVESLALLFVQAELSARSVTAMFERPVLFVQAELPARSVTVMFERPVQAANPAAVFALSESLGTRPVPARECPFRSGGRRL